MANDLNQCNFIGRLGADVDMRFTAKGDAIASFRIGCGYEYRDKSANKVEHTEWVTVNVFGKLAELCGQYLTKGSQVYVGGRLKTEKYQKDGQDRYITKLLADKVQFIGNKMSEQPKPLEQPASESADEFENFESDIPF